MKAFFSTSLNEFRFFLGLLWDKAIAWLKKEDLPPRPVCSGIDEQALKKEYLDQKLDQVADNFVLYRIIGNDLYPRHQKGQSRKNLEFIIEHEPELENCEKRWVVNRIVDRQEEKRIIDLLEKHDQKFLHLPFDPEVYAHLGWAMETFPAKDFLNSQKYQKLPLELKMRALVQTYRHKNNYVMNNNGARNAALRQGRRIAKWVLPWDGNCFLTKSAWQEITSKILAYPYYKYFIVPMTRVQDNQDLLDPDFRPEPNQEPQIIFRFEAKEEFDQSFPYGRRPKVELLWRLGVPGPWQRWKKEPWDLPFPELGAEAGQFAFAGWVARLFSGNPELEENKQLSFFKRGPARIEAIISFLNWLDQEILRPDPNNER